VKISSQTIRRVTSAPVAIAISLTWLAAVLYIVIGKVIVREATMGGILARQIDKLPLLLAKPVYVVLWYLFFLGWIVPLALGIKRLLRRTGHDFPVGRNGAAISDARR
jgi:hypothetical protein